MARPRTTPLNYVNKTETFIRDKVFILYVIWLSGSQSVACSFFYYLCLKGVLNK